MPALGPRAIDQAAARSAGEASGEVWARRIVRQVQPGAGALADRAAKFRAAAQAGSVRDEVVSEGNGLRREPTGRVEGDGLARDGERDRHAVRS